MNELITVSEAAEEVGVDKRTITRAIESGELKAQKPGRGKTSAWIILRADLERYKKARQLKKQTADG